MGPHQIIFANPCKQSSHIKYAADHDVTLMTFDSEEELLKINDIYPNAKYVQSDDLDIVGTYIYPLNLTVVPGVIL